MIVLIEGGLGSGKTVLAVRYAKKDELRGKKIYANLHLKEMNYELLNIGDFLENEDVGDRLKNATILIDEITVFMDCRTSMKKGNQYMSYLILQSRKRDLNIYATTQDITMCDKRLVNYTSVFVIAEKIYNKIEMPDGSYRFFEVENHRHYTSIDVRTPRQPNITRFNLDISKWFKYYDTDEIIEPIDRWITKDVKQK